MSPPVSAPVSALGTRLRHLIELLDTSIQSAYDAAGLTFRPRYTPIVRALLARGPVSIRALAIEAAITHSAASQTVTQMARDGLLDLRPGADARERIVALTPAAEAMLPQLQAIWAAVSVATFRLDDELTASLSTTVDEALAALARHPFSDRITDATPPAP